MITMGHLNILGKASNGLLPVERMMIPSTRRAWGQTTRILASASTHSAKHDYTWLDRVFEGGVLPILLIHVTICDKCLV